VADRIAEGVWWLHGTRGSNVYAIEAGGELALVDTGFRDSLVPILAELESIAPGRRLHRILLTHAHRDHSGAAAALRSETGARVVAGIGDTHLDRSGFRVLASGPSRHRIVSRLARALARRPVIVAGIEVDEALEGDGEVIPGLRAVHVPGHTAGSYCFVLDDRGIAFVGDLVISHPARLARPMAMTNADDRQYLESLAAFAATAPPSGCPGHGNPVIGTFAEAIRETASHPRRHILAPSLLFERARMLARFTGRVARRRLPVHHRLP